MKPNWKDAPEWADWLAQAEDKTWYWYEYEPKPNFYRGLWQAHHAGARQSAELDWENSLEQRP